MAFLRFFGLNVPVYGAFFAAGCVFAALLGFYRCKKARLDVYNALIIAACAIGAGLICSKLLFLLVSLPFSAILRLISQGRAAELLSGGQVYIGGLIGGILGAFIGARVAECPINDYARAFVPALPLGCALGRMGCFFAGCCYGAPYSGAFAVTYARAVGGAPSGVSLFPVQAAEALADIVIFLILLRYTKSASGFRAALLYCLLYCPARFGLEFLRFDALRGVFFGLSTSQWICAALFFAAFALFFAPGKSKSA